MGKHKSLDELKEEFIGKTFNYLTIVDVEKDNKHTWFKCQCTCGNVKLISKYEILRNKTISCGCNHKSEKYSQQLQNNINNLKVEYIGKTFNKLTILDIFRNNKSEIIFKCQCTCGKLVEYNKFSIINNKVFSCGCYKHSDEHKNKLSKIISTTHAKLDDDKLKDEYIGKTFNNLTVLDVIRVHDKYNKEKITFKCQCSCGCIKNILKDKVLSGKTKSCGCYAKSDEVLSNIKYSLLQVKHNKRININWKLLLSILHPNYHNDLLNGKLKTDSVIETKCPICNNYEKHTLGNVYILSRSEFAYKNKPPLCNKCREQLVTSSYEDEIEDFIKSFYDGEIVRNTRSIISPQELDIFIPEKKIAIEFNGDYWHSSEFKDKDYHYNKYLKCKENNVILVSVFESEWNKNKDSIKEYIYDLFNGKENKLSFNDNKTLMNNNYPNLNIKCSDSVICDSFLFNKNIIYNCGYSQIIY